MEVLVQPLNRIVQVEPGANLLEALRAAQVPMSYSCMAGRCGTCRCKLVAGDVLEGGGDQQRPINGGDAHVLACRTYITEPCTIEIPEPDEVVVHTARIVKATVVGLEDLTHDIKRVVLKPAKPIEFSPVQYVQLQLTPEHARPYSMAGLSDDGMFEFHVRLVSDGHVTGYIANQLKIGDAVKVRGARSRSIPRAITSTRATTSVHMEMRAFAMAFSKGMRSNALYTKENLTSATESQPATR